MAIRAPPPPNVLVINDLILGLRDGFCTVNYPAIMIGARVL